MVYTSSDHSAFLDHCDNVNASSALDDLNVNHGLGPIPKKRQNRASFLSISLSVVVVLVMVGVFTKQETEYEVVSN